MAALPGHVSHSLATPNQGPEGAGYVFDGVAARREVGPSDGKLDAPHLSMAQLASLIACQALSEYQGIGCGAALNLWWSPASGEN